MFVRRKTMEREMEHLKQLTYAHAARLDERLFELAYELEALKSYLKVKKVILPQRVEIRSTEK
jgi:hypothetical protein